MASNSLIDMIRRNNQKIEKPGLRDTINNANTAASTPAVVADDKPWPGIATLDKPIPTSMPSPAPIAPSLTGTVRAEPPAPTITNLTVTADKLKRPEDINKVLDHLDSLTGDLPPEKQAIYEQQKQKIIGARDSAFNQYNDAKDTNKWLQIAETMGQALTQLGAGIYGLKNNVDMSGLKFNKNDWSKDMDLAGKELDRKLGAADLEEAYNAKDKNRAIDTAENKVDFRKKAIIGDYMERQKSYNDQVLEAQKLITLINKGESKTAGKQESDQAKQAAAELKLRIKAQEQKVANLDKALAEAGNLAAGDKNASIAKVSNILGGELGEKFRANIITPGLLWGTNTHEDRAPEVVKAYLEQAKNHLNELKQAAPSLSSPNNVISGTIKMRHPNGEERNVPANQVEQAKAAGYTISE